MYAYRLKFTHSSWINRQGNILALFPDLYTIFGLHCFWLHGHQMGDFVKAKANCLSFPSNIVNSYVGLEAVPPLPPTLHAQYLQHE